MQLFGGTVYLTNFHRRTREIERMFLFEATASAALVSGLAATRWKTGDVFAPESLGTSFVGALIGAVLWLLLGLPLLTYVRRTCADYIETVFTDGSMLYLILEHIPHDDLLQGNFKRIVGISVARTGTSFKARIQRLEQRYPRYAGRLGWRAYPRQIRMLSIGLKVVYGLLSLLFIWQAISLWGQLQGGGLDVIWPAQVAGTAMILGALLVGAVMRGQRLAIRYAIVATFLGELPSGKATPASY